VALGGTLIQEMASLSGLVQEGPALIDACLLRSACPDDLVPEGAGHGREHPRPWVSSVGLSCDPRRPPQYLWQGRRWGSGGPRLRGGHPPLAARLGAALVPDAAAVLVEGASGVVVVLATEGAAAAVPVISGVPPALGGSVVLGAAAAPGADCASVDA
jgi:hypothetical protein